VPLIVAGRGEVYGACYDADSSPPVERVAAWVGAPDRVPETLGPGPAVLFGSGAGEVRARLPAALDGVRFAATPRGVAGAAGRLALVRPRSAEESGDPLSPLYLRPPDALLGT
jgi:tRNA A37 threonylcarbamoyladenosine modification protein TsaB